FAMYQSLVNEAIIPEELLWKGVPEESQGDYDALMDIIDWDLNVDPKMMENRFMNPVDVHDRQEMEAQGFSEKWICYKSTAFSAKELTVYPGQTVTITDGAAYGLIMMQGYGKLNDWTLETPSSIRFGQLTFDEYFVSEQAAKKGVIIQ